MTKSIEFVISGTGTRGDVHPLIGIGKNLLSRGYRVTLLTNEYFEDDVIKNGLPFYPIGKKSEYDLYFGDERVWESTIEMRQIGFEKYHAPSICRSYEFVSNRFTQNKNIIVITISQNNGARMAADALGLQAVLITLSPNLIPSTVCPPVPERWACPDFVPEQLRSAFFKIRHVCLGYRFAKSFEAINKVRKSYKLPKYTNNSMKKNKGLHLCFFPHWYANPPKDWPENIHYVGFPVFDPKFEEEQDFEQFKHSDKKPIVFLSGTGVVNPNEFFQQGVEICENLSLPGVFIGGRSSIALKSEKIKIFQADYANLDKLLPCASMLIHHGGIGSLAKAIQYCLPQVIRPLGFDQPDNGVRVKDLGLGYVVWPDAFKADKITKLVAALISSESMKSRIGVYSKTIRSDSAINKACDQIEKEINSEYPSNKLSIIWFKEFTLRLNAKLKIQKNTISKYPSSLNYCTAIVLERIGIKIDPAHLIFKDAFTLPEIKEIFNNINYDLNLFHCSTEELINVHKPCIIFDEINRPSVLLYSDEKYFIISKQDFGIIKRSKAEFNSFYSGTIIEVSARVTEASTSSAD